MDNHGLNGFWGSFWSGFKSIFTASTSDDNAPGFGGRIGRIFGRALNSLTQSFFQGALRVGEYTPTSSELVILSPIKTALNSWIIGLTQNIEALLNQNNNDGFLIAVNATISQLQILRDYLQNNQLQGLSVDAMDYLVEQIDLMLKSYEATIEDLLIANAITFSKLETTVSKSVLDTIPSVLAIPNGYQTVGSRYEIPQNETTVISTQVPINENTVVAANNTTTTPQNTTSNDGMNKKILFGLFASLVLYFTFKKNN